MLIRELVFHLHLEERYTEYIIIYLSAFKPLTKINLQQQNEYPNNLSQYHQLHNWLLLGIRKEKKSATNS